MPLGEVATHLGGLEALDRAAAVRPNFANDYRYTGPLQAHLRTVEVLERVPKPGEAEKGTLWCKVDTWPVSRTNSVRSSRDKLQSVLSGMSGG